VGVHAYVCECMCIIVCAWCHVCVCRCGVCVCVCSCFGKHEKGRTFRTSITQWSPHLCMFAYIYIYICIYSVYSPPHRVRDHSM